MKMKHIPNLLVGVRALSFIPIILSTFNVASISVPLQIILSTIIMTSDMFDGKISRKYNNEKDKLRFRILDSITDKTGIGLCLLGLILTHKITIPFASLLIGYNTILMSGGLIALLSSKEKKEKNVRGLFLSRLFTALTGISIILLNNVTLNFVAATLLTSSMGVIGASSLLNQLKDKLKQRKESINNDKERVCEYMSNKNIEKQTKTYLKSIEKKESKDCYNSKRFKGFIGDVDKEKKDTLVTIKRTLNCDENYAIDQSVCEQAYEKAMREEDGRISSRLLYLGAKCASDSVNESLIWRFGKAVDLNTKVASMYLDYKCKSDRLNAPSFSSSYDEQVLYVVSKVMLDIAVSDFSFAVGQYEWYEDRRIREAYKYYLQSLREQMNAASKNCKTMKPSSAKAFNLGLRVGRADFFDSRDERSTEIIAAPLEETIQGFTDIDYYVNVASKVEGKNSFGIEYQILANNKILNQVPSSLFSYPYTVDDIIKYVKDHKLLEKAFEEEMDKSSDLKEKIKDISDKKPRVFLLDEVNRIENHSRKRINNI